MKTTIGSLSLLGALLAGLGGMPAGRAAAQTFTTLHDFSALSTSGIYDTNTDGAYPYGGLALSSNVLYGAAYEGGTSGYGTVFAVSNNGTGFTTLHSFTDRTDGGYPYAGLVVAGNTLYGTAEEGGSSTYYGTVYSINTDGTGFAVLHDFTYTRDGGYPAAGMILSGSTLYGTADDGGSTGYGTVFSLSTNGTGFTNLHSFSYSSDGGFPDSRLVLSGSTLYGTAEEGGRSGYGTVFGVSTAGTGFTNLHSFAAIHTNSAGSYTNSDGAYPFGGLAVSGNTLYGTTYEGGSAGYGTLFSVNTDGTGFAILHDFTYSSDGGYPEGELLLSGSTLYGTTDDGGSSGGGTIFAINTNGTGFTVLHDFSYTSDGAYPNGGLVLWSSTLYGTAWGGGSGGDGTVFALSTVSLQFTASPSFGAAPLTVYFTSPGTDNFGNAITSWNWNFGDGATSTAQNPSHTYSNPGDYSPSLQAAEGSGLQLTEAGPSITVSQPTLVLFTANPTTGLAPLTVSFSSAGTDNAGNAINHWNWSFGDGTTSTARNPSHTYTTGGVFFPALAAGNNVGSTAVGFGPAAITATNAPAYLGLVLNGGFETGDLTGWTLSGAAYNDIDIFVDNGSASGISPYSGKYLAALGSVGSLNYLSQSLPTSAGAAYFISFWLNSPDGLSPNEFSVSWNGSTVYDQTDIPAIGWTNYQYMVSAAGTSSTLSIGFQDDPSYLGLDNVSVLPAQPGISSLQLIGTNWVLAGNNGLSGQTYYVLASTNLTLPLSQWTPIATNVPGANGNFAILFNQPAISGAGQQYYILQLQ